VADPASALVVTSQFICTRSDIAGGRSYWLTPVAPRGHAVIELLQQAVVTAGLDGSQHLRPSGRAAR